MGKKRQPLLSLLNLGSQISVFRGVRRLVHRPVRRLEHRLVRISSDNGIKLLPGPVKCPPQYSHVRQGLIGLKGSVGDHISSIVILLQAHFMAPNSPTHISTEILYSASIISSFFILLFLQKKANFSMLIR